MVKEDTLRLLLEANAPLSGEGISQRLGVSRAAVWKAVEALRGEGYAIDSRPGLGYRLTAAPDRLSPGELARPGALVGHEVICLDRVDSTNNECRRRAAQGAPGGLVVVSGEQTGGKGRRGRTFQSLPGKGLYLSALLRPGEDLRASLTQVTQLTAWSAVAVCEALEEVSGLSCGIKWVNDVILEGKKTCGILCELGLDDDGRADHVVVGIGINVSQTEADFGPELSSIATSLGQHMAAPPRRAEVARALIGRLDQLWRAFPGGCEDYLSRYRARCLTVGREVRLVRADGEIPAFALGINDDFSLRVRRGDGTEEDVSAGEVSVRGLLGYT